MFEDATGIPVGPTLKYAKGEEGEELMEHAGLGAMLDSAKQAVGPCRNGERALRTPRCGIRGKTEGERSSAAKSTASIRTDRRTGWIGWLWR